MSNAKALDVPAGSLVNSEPGQRAYPAESQGDRAPGRGGYRADIDGLRAIAVTSVVLYHADHDLLPSGFVGVDIFFVISGYLIGGIIFAEIATRRFSYMAFYVRRARRILPALITLTAAVSLASLFLLGAGELFGFGRQTLAALFGVSNIYFWWTTGYFTADAALNPYLMTWSLGVEEQFYVVFPFLIFAASRLRHRHQLAALALTTIMSFAVSILMIGHAPTAAFYLLPARAWEMAAGATLAVAYRDARPLPFLNNRGSDGAGLVGLALLIASICVFNDNTPFPGYAALLPVAGTLLLLHTSQSLVNRRLLSAKPMVFIGLVSYSWYLWHWPLMAWGRIAADYPPPPIAMLALAAISLGLAILSWRYVERPFRHMAKPDLATLRNYAAALLLTACLPGLYIATKGLPQRLPASARSTAAIYSMGVGRCLPGFGQPPVTGKYCQPPGAKVALLGDSHAAALSPGLRQAVVRQGESLLQLEYPACTPLVGITTSNAGQSSQANACQAFNQRSLDRIKQDPTIRLVVVAGSWPNTTDTRYIDAMGKRIDSSTALAMGLPPLLEELTAAGKSVVLVGDVPRFDFDPMRHVMSDQLPVRRAIARWLGGTRRPDGESVDQLQLDARYIATTKEVRDIALAHDGVRYFNLSDQMCDSRRCYFARGGKPLFYDQHHLSYFGATSIDWAPVLNRASH